MITIHQAPVKQRICEGRRTAVECASGHDQRRNNWNQSTCGAEAGTDSNRYEGRQKSCPAVRDSAKRCRCIVQGRRACISPAPSRPPEERALRVVPARPDIDQFSGYDTENEVPGQTVPFETRCCFQSEKTARRFLQN